MGGTRKSAKEIADKAKARIAATVRGYSAAGRDIGEIPKVANRSRRRRAEKSLLVFCQTYFKHLFPLKFSPAHLAVIEAIDKTATQGGLQAIAMPRASGKSTLCEVGAIWSLLCNHRKFVVLIGSTETASKEQLENLKAELQFNELLQSDFPEALFPISKLEGISKRCLGQTCCGKPTSIIWSANEVVLPTVEGSKVSGATLRVAGITGRIRGTKKTTADGKSIRPDYVLLDDVQTEESSKSAMQCAERLKLISGAVLGLAGVKTKISAMMACTVISKGDLADVLLDRKLYPEWNGIRVKMLESEPENKVLWQKYEDILGDSLRERGDISLATDFYRKNKAAMDLGAKVYWDERFEKGEISAIQNAMNLKIRDERSFASEYQNQPLAEDYGITDRQISIEDLRLKLNGLERGIVPESATMLTAFVDIQKEILWYVVLASDASFNCSVIEYGGFPEQGSSFFDLTNLRKSLSDVYGGSTEGNCYRGLTDLLNAKMSQEYTREDGVTMKIERCLIDAGWGEVTDTVYRVAKESPFSAMLLPSHGRGITASSLPMSRYKKRPGEQMFHDAIVTLGGAKNRKHISVDVNSWKSFFQARLLTPVGERGCLTIYGGNKTNHQLLFDHLTSEYFRVTSGAGRTLKEWKIRPDRQRNDLLDCLVGCLVGAHLVGASMPEWQGGSGTKSKPISLSSLHSGVSSADSNKDVLTTGAEDVGATIASTGVPKARVSLRELQRGKK